MTFGQVYTAGTTYKWTPTGDYNLPRMLMVAGGGGGGTRYRVVVVVPVVYYTSEIDYIRNRRSRSRTGRCTGYRSGYTNYHGLRWISISGMITAIGGGVEVHR